MRLAFVLSFAVALLNYAPEDREWMLDDFEDGDMIAVHGLGWVGLGDDLLGGASRIELEVVAPGAHGSRHALVLQGRVGDASPAFTGAWVPLEGLARPVDLSAFDGIRLSVRGEGTFQVGVRRGPPNAAVNFMAPFTATAEWKSVQVGFDRLTPAGPASKGATWSPKEVHWLGVTTAPGAHGPFRLEIDDVALVGHEGAGPAAPVASSGPPRVVRLRASPAPPKGSWRELARDPAGDGKQKSLPDATSLSVQEDAGGGIVWFRIGLAAPPPEPWFGVNLALDTDGNPDNGTPWWGANTAFRFDRLVTLWVFRTADAYQGVAGVADAAQVAGGELMGEAPAGLLFFLDRQSPAILVGVPRAALGSPPGAVRVVAAVGSALSHNDDVPDAGAALLPR